MCAICENKDIISRTIELSENREMTTSVRFDGEQEDILKVRVQLGSLGYTLPIKANYCFICGKDLRKEVKSE
ncbi:hypothetical protein CVD28_00755 [Bacillus sp. M6-12]|uniref:hypothetical protein n=1 Tax=Bacillus sp. M6-12 TaxID=2054166 RepID=UPI000C787144|nr:hypothetical protein [Bacillus sp. M6-12]PLS18963.1 hypothetical protein CVD28_00755 [Bacillus sp. M6-12]